MPIYTKRGDKGITTIFRKIDGKPVEVAKNTPIISAIGAIDELNSFLGIVLAFSGDKLPKKELIRIQENLLTISSILAGSKLKFSESESKHLEKSIDRFDKEIAPLKNFIFPQGTKTSSLLQYSRTLARSAERKTVSLSDTQFISPSILKYLNRLSDYLYTLSRWINLKEGGKETVWNPR